MSIKLNLACGSNVIAGYKNIDSRPVSSDVQYGDIRNLDRCGVEENTVEEILALGAISTVAFAELSSTLQNWISKLMPGGNIFIEDADANLLAVAMTYDQMTIEDLNLHLYRPQVKGIYSLKAIDHFIRSLNMPNIIVEEKSYKGNNFIIRIRKLA